MEIGAYRKREHCFPSSFFVQADLDSFVFSAFGVVPLSLQAYISFHHSLVGLELSLMGTTISFVKEQTTFLLLYYQQASYGHLLHQMMSLGLMLVSYIALSHLKFIVACIFTICFYYRHYLVA